MTRRVFFSLVLLSVCCAAIEHGRGYPHGSWPCNAADVLLFVAVALWPWTGIWPFGGKERADGHA